MNKEELIALSDLNRKDNIKYISSEAQGIAITLDSDKYAPTLCKLERAYICGRRKSEEQIEQLEQENAELKETVIKMNNVITETFSNLTKAKDLIDKLLHGGFILPCYKKDAIIVKAEQFINSEVEK